MNPAPHRRRDFRVLATRWIHVLWLMPLVGVLAGLWTHSSKFAHISSGTIQIRFGPLVFAPGACIPSNDQPTHPALSSPELLQAVVAKQDLESRWGLTRRDCLDRLRGMIRSRAIEDTALTEISVRGWNIEESIAICRTVLEEFRQIVSKETANRLSPDLAWAKEAAIRQEELVDRKRAELSDLLRSNKHFGLNAAKTAFEEAQRELGKLKIRETKLELDSKVLEPVLVHEWPSASLPASLRSEWIRSLLFHLVRGISAGALLAIALMYLLEWIFPPLKRTAREQPATPLP